MVIGNIGIGNISTLATLNDHLGEKCFAFSSSDKSNIPDILAKIRYCHTGNAKFAILCAVRRFSNRGTKNERNESANGNMA